LSVGHPGFDGAAQGAQEIDDRRSLPSAHCSVSSYKTHRPSEELKSPIEDQKEVNTVGAGSKEQDREVDGAADDKKNSVDATHSGIPGKFPVELPA
jgi:hypothetical protein